MGGKVMPTHPLHLAREVVKVCGTNDPFIVADYLGIEVCYESLPSHIGGFFTRIFDSAYIVVNSEKPRAWQRAIAAHELGHALLHTQDNAFLATSNFATHSKIEREANQFAAALLIGDEALTEGESIYEFAQRMNVPVEFVQSLHKDFFLGGRLT
jgi:Zn-dependent peptidase ImmA (M78 family)